MDISEIISNLRAEYRKYAGISTVSNADFLASLPGYCDWLEEEIAAQKINEGVAAQTTNSQSTPCEHEWEYQPGRKCSKCGEFIED